MFLVITGFLATRSVTGALERGDFGYGRYLLRRGARLLPPVLVTIALTALATYLVSPSLLPKVQADALPSALFLGNWSTMALAIQIVVCYLLTATGHKCAGFIVLMTALVTVLGKVAVIA